MNPVKAIRDRLGVTQQSVATALGCTQGNVGNYEAGQAIPPAMASKLIDYAASLGLRIGFDHIYGRAALPKAAPAKAA